MTGSIPNRVHHYRERARLTQQQLADAVGAGRVTISRAERGTQEPTLDLARRLADALNCGLDDLFGNDPRGGYDSGRRAGFSEGAEAVVAEWRRKSPDSVPVSKAIQTTGSSTCVAADTSGS